MDAEAMEAIEANELWQEVRRRSKNPLPKNKEVRDKIRVEREELDFQFDEELDVPMGKINTFSSDWAEDETDEVSDKDINKLLIVTQCTGVPASAARPPKHEGYDRTGDWTTRVKITQDLEQEINDGLYYYQEDLWTTTDGRRERTLSGSYKTVTVISQADFEKIAPPAPKKQNPEVPPPPPPGPVSASPSSGPSRRTRQPVYRGPRFYAVTKDECPDPRTPRKRKTRHSNNPPVEHHVGWIMDVKEHRPRTSSAG